MKHKISAAIMAAVMAMTLMTGCSSQNNGKSSSSSNTVVVPQGNAVINADEMEEAFKDIPELSGDGPLLTLSNTTAKAGELAEVTLSVSNADLQWSMCGIHIIYPEVLKPDMSNPAEREVRFTKGSALEESSGYVCMEWQEGLPPILTEKKQGCTFFTCMFSGNKGYDGDIATIYLKVPENAQPGAVYKLGYYYMTTDLFINEQNIQPFQKYAFMHMQGGTITVE